MTLAPHIVTFGRSAAAAVELFKLIDRVSDIDAFNSSGLKPDGVQGNIQLSAVKFSYPTRPDVTVLDDFTVNIPAGKVTALVVRMFPSDFAFFWYAHHVSRVRVAAEKAQLSDCSSAGTTL